TPPPTQHLTPAQYAATLVSSLSLDDELGQLMLVQFSGLHPTPDALQMVNSQGVAGVLFFAANIQSAGQITDTTSQLQNAASLPLFITVDQEGGPVNRFRSIVGPLPSAASLADTAAARARGVQDAGILHQYGFNLNLAPVADVGTSNPQLAGRTF